MTSKPCSSWLTASHNCINVPTGDCNNRMTRPSTHGPRGSASSTKNGVLGASPWTATAVTTAALIGNLWPMTKARHGRPSLRLRRRHGQSLEPSLAQTVTSWALVKLILAQSGLYPKEVCASNIARRFTENTIPTSAIKSTLVDTYTQPLPPGRHQSKATLHISAYSLDCRVNVKGCTFFLAHQNYSFAMIWRGKGGEGSCILCPWHSVLLNICNDSDACRFMY